MPIVANGYYNDPSLGQAFASLGKAFAPPSAADILARAKTDEVRQKIEQLSSLYADPNQADFDRRAIVAGLQTGKTSLYAVDQDNATSRANNAATNATTLQQERIRGQNELGKLYATPITVGEGQTVYLPQQTQAATGLGPLFGGAIKLNPGQEATLPDGRVVSGASVPLTEDQVKAKVLGSMPLDQQQAVTYGNTPVERVVGPDGTPTFSTRMGAVGQRPAPTDSGPSTVSKLQAERAALPPNDPRAAELTSAIDAAGRGQVQDPFTTAAGADAAKNYSEMAKAGQTARSFQSDVDTLGELLTDAPTGVTAPGRLKAAKFAQAMGLNDVAAGLTGGKMDNLTAANAIAQRMAPALRVPGSGAQSDRELQNFLDSIPSIATQPGGNKIILDTLRGGAVYKQQVGEIAQRALRGEITRADADAQIAAVPTPFSAFTAARGAQPPAAPAPAGGGGTDFGGQPVRVSTPDEARKLPSGTPIVLPDGSTGRVP